MIRTFHILTGEYPPHAGGVGDYTELLAQGLADRGCTVHVWSPAAVTSEAGGVQLHRLPDTFGPGSRQALGAAFAASAGCVLLQYVPNALGARGANVRFCAWLWRAGRDADVRVMFHEPYFYFAWQRPSRNALAVAQRVMAALLLRASSVVYFSTESWRAYLGSWTPARTRMVVTPIPTTIARSADQDAIAAWRARFTGGDVHACVAGHFGTYGDHVATELHAVIDELLAAAPDVRLVCLGRGSEEFVAGLPRAWQTRVIGTGALSRIDLAAALRACDLAVQPYPDGVTTRRTSVMAALANGVATVTTSGALTERVWSEHRAVALTPAGQPGAMAAAVTRLLRAPGERAALAARGRQTYDAAFALERTIEALLEARPEPAAA